MNCDATEQRWCCVCGAFYLAEQGRVCGRGAVFRIPDVNVRDGRTSLPTLPGRGCYGIGCLEPLWNVRVLAAVGKAVGDDELVHRTPLT